MRFICVLLMLLCLLPSCGKEAEKNGDSTAGYECITAERARELMETVPERVILDVRSEEEFAEGHIPGAIVIPHTEIEAQVGTILQKKDQLILVYCRSGRRSKIAAEAMVKLGYTNVKEFGGIIDWPYEVTK